MEEVKLAPIVLFAYARPEHTRRTLESLLQNTLAPQSSLFIYVDGIKNGASERTVSDNALVKQIVRTKQWCGRVEVIEQPVNKGLALSIRDGVTDMLNRFGKVIVLEDDLELSPAFLSYMNTALDFYYLYPAVFSIGGYSYPEKIMHIPDDYEYDVYACLRNCSWGWATWRDRWEKIDWRASNYLYIKLHPAVCQAFNRMGDDEFEMLYSQQEKGLNIWSILFTMAHFENHAVAIIPCESYVNNIGLDGTGENCSIQPALEHKRLNTNANPKMLNIIYEDARIINAFYNVNCRQRLPLWKRAINRLSRKLLNKPLFLKGKVYV